MANLGNVGKTKTGILPYVLLLLVAVIVLFYISYASFQQNSALRKSTELVSRTQNTISEINLLFANYTSTQAAGVQYLITGDSTYLAPIKDYISESNLNLNKLKLLMGDNKEQLSRLKKVPLFSEQLFEQLQSIEEETARNILQSKALSEKIHRIERVRDSLEAIQKAMIGAERAMLKTRRSQYESHVVLTPTHILYSALFALGILMFAFTKINSDRKQMDTTGGFLRNILDNTDNIINFYEPIRDKAQRIVDFKIGYTNAKDRQDLKVAHKEAIGKKFSDVFPFLAKKEHVDLLRTAIEEKRTLTLETDYFVEGERIWLHTTASPLNNGVATTVRNTTTERIAERKLLDLNTQLEAQNKELAQTSGFLTNLVSSFQYIISYFEAVRNDQGQIIDFKIAYTNEKIIELMGRPSTELQGKLISEVYPFLLKNGDWDVYNKVIETGEPIEVEREYHLPKGHFIFCNEIVKLDDGVTILSQDITLRKEAEKELQRSKDALKVQNTILNNAERIAGIGSFNLDIDSGEMEYSDNAYRLFGYKPGEFEPSFDRFLSFLKPSEAKRLKDMDVEALKQKKQVKSKYKIKTKEGKMRYMASMVHFIEKDGRSYMVGVIRDITDKTKNEQNLKLKNRALKRTNAELESFNRVASHDLQEPLRKIQMFISRLSEFDRNNLSDKGQRYLAKIEDSANRMQLLIRNLLSYSRISEELSAPIKVNLNHVFQKVLDDYSERIQETGAEITVPDLPAVHGTDFQLEQLFSNLISNSLKYKKPDVAPQIQVTYEIVEAKKIDPDLNLPKSRYLRLSVKDNGIGFEQQQSQKIFKLFERLHEKHAYTGTGLGLAICKKIVENHRGHISAQSHPGQGTTFEILLPFS
ncbi:ATP-binding protein [Pseudozobellia thermophila]|uniref:histidine kinase n=1 Tax=Pseudozobellia thermophila TaxID=192903 RepID=A0A1M6M8U1_9FLAO|nr:ATP-binding protein [Pseudozobellia thermophila]SHJ79866.1 PAS domain S-box-containing protein [Pseudozobellia thermophila]